MIDKTYLQTAISKVEQEMIHHDEKFAGNAAHADCLPRFAKTLEKLNQELAKLEQTNEAER